MSINYYLDNQKKIRFEFINKQSFQIIILIIKKKILMNYKTKFLNYCLDSH